MRRGGVADANRERMLDDDDALPTKRNESNRARRRRFFFFFSPTANFSVLVFVPLFALIAPARLLSLMIASRSRHRREEEEE